MILAYMMSSVAVITFFWQASGNATKNLGYLFAAYAAVWLILLGYLISIARRQNRLDREIALLQQMKEEV